MSEEYGVIFGDLAQEIVAEFSEELGEATLKHRIGDTYDTDTGANIPSFDNYTTLMVFDEIETDGGNREYEANHQLCIIAGGDVPVVPAQGDIIVKQSGTEHKIVMVIVDQYQAAYNLHIERKPL